MTVEMFLMVRTRDRQLERRSAWNPCSTPTTTIIAFWQKMEQELFKGSKGLKGLGGSLRGFGRLGSCFGGSGKHGQGWLAITNVLLFEYSEGYSLTNRPSVAEFHILISLPA